MTPHIDTQDPLEHTAFQSINIGRVPILDVISAVQNGDETALRALLQGDDIEPSQFFSVVREMAFSYTHQIHLSRTKDGLSHFEESKVVLCPVVHSPAPTGNTVFNGAMDSALIVRLGDEMQVWGRQLSSASIITPLIDQMRLSQMGALQVRGLLKQVATGTFDPNQFDHLRAERRVDLPVLSYLMVIMTRRNGMPFLPDGNTPCTAVRGLVESIVKWGEPVCSGGPLAGFQPRVGTPIAGGEAVESGLLMWLDAVHETHTIERWDIHMLSAHEFELTLVVSEASAEPVVCRLQPHHLGMDGVERILARVACLTGQRYTEEVAH